MKNKPQTQQLENSRSTYWYILDHYNHRYGMYATEEKARHFAYLCKNEANAIKKAQFLSVDLNTEELEVFLKTYNCDELD